MRPNEVKRLLRMGDQVWLNGTGGKLVVFVGLMMNERQAVIQVKAPHVMLVDVERLSYTDPNGRQTIDRGRYPGARRY